MLECPTPDPALGGTGRKKAASADTGPAISTLPQTPRRASRGEELREALQEARGDPEHRPAAIRRLQTELSAWAALQPPRPAASPHRGAEPCGGSAERPDRVRTPSPVDERVLFLRSCRAQGVAAVPCLLTRRREEVYDLSHFGAGDRLVQVPPRLHLSYP